MTNGAHGKRDGRRPISEFVRIASLGAPYSIAFTREDGGFDVVESFLAIDNDAANEYAEQHYDGRPWYVLDPAGRNINGGDA
jgi:hypothetical protein